MRSRRWAREVALQALYRCDAIGDWSEASRRAFFEHFYPQFLEGEDPTHSFCHALVNHGVESLAQIDELINQASINWKTERMVMIDRNILRLSVVQFLHFSDIPVRVVIDEALEITKRFSSPDATTFVNGVLDKISRLVSRGVASSAIPVLPPKLVGNQ